ncbi:hypothetical protein OAT67_04155 [Bacteriovoracaceae bacterium]|nr:hypothetical protein [Bacteriovoracaceae bacterium]
MSANIILATTVLYCLSVNSYGYFDMGTGSMIIQAVIGGLVASLAFIKMNWTRIKTYFKSKK